ncbi:hypothetical protein [Winogradskyella sp. SYSU M77433]|uniref:hypothetical protein n=1 Tax=Winogradskyella sp. SYSU M77433 TaxID=3042722 RepID=UPI002480BA2E|nr:hypothetical protein [Winogradskyella sp. SYSU M77433]
MKENMDFRVIPPKKRYSKFYEEEVYIIPCKVLYVGNQIKGKIYNIYLEILDFNEPKIIKASGITYKGSLDYFLEPPFITECVVRKHGKCHYTLIVYSVSNPGLVEKLFGVKEILNTEEEILDFYNHNYNDFRNWLFEIKNKQDIRDIDLPF